jgi:hypothetical protein
MAEALGHKEDAELFYRRAANYRNLFDRNVNFFRGRKADSSWRKPFNPIALVGDEYVPDKDGNIVVRIAAAPQSPDKNAKICGIEAVKN